MADVDLTVLCAAAAQALAEAEKLAADLSDQQFASPSGPLGASVGQHLRHGLDHFRALLDGFEGNSEVAYDERDRGTAIETDREAARALAAGLRGRLETLDNVQLNFEVDIRVMVACDGTDAKIRTTLGREIAFATHHMIHHFAMIKAICTEQGVTLPEEFGRAPSTVAYERSN